MKEKKSNFRGKVGDNAKKSRRGGGGFAYLKVPQGTPVLTIPENTRKVKLDFMPYEVTDKNHPDRDDNNEVAIPGSLWYKRPFMLHRNIGTDNKNYICRKSIGKPCPICEAQSEMWDKDHDGAVALYPKDRILYAPIPIDLDKHDEVPHVWDMAESLFQDALKDELAEDSDNEIFPDLEEGKTLEVSFKWKTIGDKGKPFPEAKNISFSDRDPYKEKILKDVPDLDQIIIDSTLSYDDLKDIFFGVDKEEEDTSTKKKSHKKDDDDEDEAPRRSNRKDKEDDDDEPRSKKSRKDDDEDEKPRAKKSEKKEEPKDDLTWEDLEEMSQSKLEKFVKSEDLDIDVDEYEDDVTALRKVIAKELDIDIPKSEKKKAEKEEEKPSRTRSEKSKKSSDDECPSGYRFGVDTDKKDECDSCSVWDACIAAKDKLKAKAR